MASFGDNFLHGLVVAIQQIRLYGANHAGAGEVVDRVYVLVTAELQASPSIRVEVGAGALTVQRDVFPVEDREAGQIIAYLTARRVGRLVIDPDLTRAELFSLVRFLAMEPEGLVAEGGLQEALLSTGSSHIEVEGASVTRGPQPPPEPADLFADAVAVVAGIYRDVSRGQPPDAARARMTGETIARALAEVPARLWRDTVPRVHDELDPSHAVITAVFASSAAKLLGVAGADLVEVATAALLHDVGLSSLPEEVRMAERTRNGPQQTWRHMTEGAYLLRDLSVGQSLPMVVALEHHGPLAAAAEGTVRPQSMLIGAADYLDAVTASRARSQDERTLGEVLAELAADPGPYFSAAHIRALVEAFQHAAASGVRFELDR